MKFCEIVHLVVVIPKCYHKLNSEFVCKSYECLSERGSAAHEIRRQKLRGLVETSI